MHNPFKTLFLAVAGTAFLACTAFAQTTKPAKTAPKPAKTAPKPASKPAVSSVSATPMLKSALDSVTYAIGISVAGSLKSQGLSDINTEVLMRGLKETLQGKPTAMTPQQGNEYIGNYFQKQTSAKGEANLRAGQKFLEENKKKPTVITTASGLQYEVLKMGEGPKPVDSSRVKVDYHGTLIDGTVFDSSVERGEPVEFPVGGVIKGWTEALQLMPTGSKFRLFIPADLAYGERPAGPSIGPNSTLIFDVDLLEILK